MSRLYIVYNEPVQHCLIDVGTVGEFRLSSQVLAFPGKREPEAANSFVRSSTRPRAHTGRCQNTFISSRLRGTHCTTLHLNYTHKYSASDVLTAQYCVHVRARAPRPRSPPAARAPTGRARSRASPGEGAERAQDGGVTRRRARASLCREPKIARHQGTRRGAGRRAARRAARALRRRAGGAAASAHLRASLGTPSGALARPR